MEIKFTDTMGIDDLYNVVPAIKEIPDWYKKTEGYTGGKFNVVDGATNKTIKKCIPVFDSITAGYIIKTYTDIFVAQKDGAPYYQWAYFTDVISHHSQIEVSNHPMNDNTDPPKLRNPWSIQTKNGYSCFFVNPMHRENNIFTILPAIVDTDKYTLPINFPFILNNKKWEGIIPAGTPVAQVIPFKRDKFKMKIENNFADDENKKKITKLNSVWNHAYKNFFWERKKYI